jgi:hypothetical protein
MRIKKITQNTRDFNITDALIDGGTDLNKDTFNGLQDNVENAIGEIIESGSNENGTWIKYADGTMICRHTITTTTQNTANHYSSINWVYPSTFSEIPTIIGTPNNWNLYACFIKVKPAITNGSIMLHFINVSTGSFVDTTGSVDVIAIGKWK